MWNGRVGLWTCLATIVALCAVPAQAAVNLQYPTGSPRVLNCDIDATSSADCDPEGYKLLLTVRAAPALVGSGLTALFVVLYFIGKYLCNCCGGREQHPNCCCPNMSLPAKYSKADLLRPRIYAVAVFFLLLGGCVWGGVATTRLRTQIALFRDVTDDSVLRLQSVALQTAPLLLAALTNASLSAEANASATAWLSQISEVSQSSADEIQRMTTDTVRPLTDFFFHFLWSVYVFSLLLVVGAVVGLMAAFCHQRAYAPALLVLFFGVVGGVGGWALYGTTLVGERLLDDVCHEVDAYVRGESHVLAAATRCNETLLAAVLPPLHELAGVFIHTSCSVLWPMCYQPDLTALQNAAQSRLFDCGVLSIASVDSCQTKGLSQLARLPQAGPIWSNTRAWTLARAYGGVCHLDDDKGSGSASDCTVQACADSCLAGTADTSLSAVGERARDVISYHEHARLVERTAQRAAQIAVFTRCGAVLDVLVPPLQEPCSVGTHWVYVVRQSTGFMALCSIFAMATYILGAKRFIPLSQALVPQYG